MVFVLRTWESRTSNVEEGKEDATEQAIQINVLIQAFYYAVCQIPCRIHSRGSDRATRFRHDPWAMYTKRPDKCQRQPAFFFGTAQGMPTASHQSQNACKGCRVGDFRSSKQVHDSARRGLSRLARGVKRVVKQCRMIREGDRAFPVRQGPHALQRRLDSNAEENCF